MTFDVLRFACYRLLFARRPRKTSSSTASTRPAPPIKIIPPGPPKPIPLSGTLVGLGWPVGDGVPGPRVAVGVLGTRVGARVAVGHAPLVGLGGIQVAPGDIGIHVGDGLGVGVWVGVLVGVLVGPVVNVGEGVNEGEGVGVLVGVASITVNGAVASGAVPSEAFTS